MNRHYQYISQFSLIAIMTIASSAIAPAFAQSAQPRQGDADRLRPAQGRPISPTNTDQFSIDRSTQNSNLKIQNVNLDVETVQPVLPGNYNTSPQKVNRTGAFSSDPLNAVQIFQESGSTRREKQ
ncbi:MULTISPECIES: hypothetical protein [Pseudanabaena]|uniref:Filamentous hemagglutinin outer membrane protein n=2 Tax=Pseudanabaena TaxID=1152 RepID=L8N103_9CYAN|nr:MULTISPECIES: hypothetical protein [Pseudanabaena]ELS33877.1 hypothetical protein Pse7429DRAFT_1101 [Pseudanabaena biceps PCC 7429]MDG3493904.1 hypothetical protein [Pseudanabaena catenata USMAC16]TYQ24461.1 hypothetical protein PseudUWO310_20795 [Pseudanabaena sp. UWO310]